MGRFPCRSRNHQSKPLPDRTSHICLGLGEWDRKRPDFLRVIENITSAEKVTSSVTQSAHSFALVHGDDGSCARSTGVRRPPRCAAVELPVRRGFITENEINGLARPANLEPLSELP